MRYSRKCGGAISSERTGQPGSAVIVADAQQGDWRAEVENVGFARDVHFRVLHLFCGIDAANNDRRA